MAIRRPERPASTIALLLMAAVASAGDLRFSDPALQSPAPAGAVGYPSRDPALDVLPGFRQPPPGYGDVGFYWWLGDPLTKERLTWQLDRLEGKGISGLQVNYAHSDKGGRSYGLTLASRPPLFSVEWWDLFGWFLNEAGRRGMSASLSDYTLGTPGNGWFLDEILREHPEIQGATLAREAQDCSGVCTWVTSAAPISITAYRIENHKIVDAGRGHDLRASLSGRALRWNAPAGEWRVIAVYAKDAPFSFDPMHPLGGKQTIEKFFQRFENHNPGQSGKGLNFFFSDELSFGVRGWLWDRYFAAEFLRRKGYDVVPELAALFDDIGPRTVKIRLDYSDVMVALEEENYFRPLYEWHRSRGMLYGCDHGGRGKDVTEFGDYFRTQRWMTGPGNDQPNLASDVIKNKVSSSITHLYQRQRTWLEGYYGSGWGTTSAQVVDATWRNFAQGQNLLTLHGLYYSTHGGWWEWAPPCNHWHMPYWNLMGTFLHTVERMAYLLSQGVHRTDVAILYPVAAMEAGPAGKEAVDTAFAVGRHLYGKSIDFDFIDFESLARAAVENRELRVSGEAYRVLVIPAMRAVRYSTIEKALEFQRRGGTVLFVGALPEASDRTGSHDPELDRTVRTLASAPGARVQDPEGVERAVNGTVHRDFVCGVTTPNVLHRKSGSRDVYFVYGAPKGLECEFRATGTVQLWDPWTGSAAPLPVLSQSAETTRLRMPLEGTDAQLIVFSPGRPRVASATPEPEARVIPVSGAWDFELKPTLDNRFGDFRLPVEAPFIGAEARRFRYAEDLEIARGSDPHTDDSQWPRTTASYGPRFWKLGPLPAGIDTAALEQRLASLTAVDFRQPESLGSATYRWAPYEFSLRWGIENDAGHQGYHGLKSEMPEDVIGLGKLAIESTTTEYQAETAGTRYYLWTTVFAPHAINARVLQGGNPAAAVWMDGRRVSSTDNVPLHSGANILLLRYDKPGKGYFFLAGATAPAEWVQPGLLASPWYNRPGLLPFDTRPRAASPAGWYRFMSPPGLRSMKLVAKGSVQAWADGAAMNVSTARMRSDGSREFIVTAALTLPDPIKVAIRIQQDRGEYAGAAIPEAIALDCSPGRIAVGDWSQIDGLASYSGGAWYRKTIALPRSRNGESVWLDLGDIAGSVEVHVNGQTAGTKLAPPWKLEITPLARNGENLIELLVYNTLANHYQTIPTRYRGSPRSGLLGPVSVQVRPQPQ